jgi:hypothetical protein
MPTTHAKTHLSRLLERASRRDVTANRAMSAYDVPILPATE